ncbi:unnamed protein product [Lupinus luteus]|uniref:Acyl-coenzyme A oxidase n=1 Tax=Lupinus luteus TaxID=3873 RepID=A0AAV1WRR2_LUPLU
MQGVDHLADERNKADFDVGVMKIVWAGSRHAYELSHRFSHLVANDPVFRKDNRPLLSRKELFKASLRKAFHAWKLIKQLRLNGHPSSLWEMFVPAIKAQGSEEQLQQWLPLMNKMKIIGCYAQTELGHGSNVRGLETTATFDPKTDEFVLNSPKLTSTKWWPGGLGKIATHALAHARLIIDDKDYGVHAQVTREGKYVPSEVPRQLSYSTMVYVRQKIVFDASIALSRAVCIATRYSAVRRQFGSQNGSPETQVIDYKTQQARLFPLLASAYAIRFVSEWLKSFYTDLLERLEVNDFCTLPEAHACTAGLKSITTSVAADGIEECRKLCGGHGYLTSSGLPELFSVYIPACTYEGDNVVMLLQIDLGSLVGNLSCLLCQLMENLTQVARHLMKAISHLNSENKPIGTTAYLCRAEQLMQYHSDVLRAEDWLKPNVVVEAFEARAAKMSMACAQNLSKFNNPDDGFQELSPDLVEAAIAHCQLIVVSKFIDKLQQDIPGKGVKQQLQVLCSIYALFLLHKHVGDFLSTGCITPEQGSLANEQLRSLYTQVRPDAVSLVDAFDYTDHFLSSVLGRYDGNVYPKLYEEDICCGYVGGKGSYKHVGDSKIEETKWIEYCQHMDYQNIVLKIGDELFVSKIVCVKD